MKSKRYTNEEGSNLGGVHDFRSYVTDQGHAPRPHYNHSTRVAVDVDIVQEKDHDKWAPLFLRSYLIYRPLSNEEVEEMRGITGQQIMAAAPATGGDVRQRREAVSENHAMHLLALLHSPNRTHYSPDLSRRLDELEETMRLNWKKFMDKDDPTICVMARPSAKQDAPDAPRIDTQRVVGITYGTRVYDPKYADYVFEIEGTYVPSEYRAHGIASQMLPAIGQSSTKLGAIEMQYWTWKENPDTKRIYSNVKFTTDELDQLLKARHTDEQIWVMGLTERTARQYGCAHTQNHVESHGNVRKLQPGDEAEFLNLSKRYLKEKNYTDGERKLEKLWHDLHSKDIHPPISAFVLEEDGKLCGFTVVQQGVKLPRDAFLTAEAVGFFIAPDKRDREHASALFRAVCEDIQAHNPQHGIKTEALRWRARSDDPHLDMLAGVDIKGDGDMLCPSLLPFKTYRLPLCAKAEAEFRAPVITHAKAKSRN